MPTPWVYYCSSHHDALLIPEYGCHKFAMYTVFVYLIFFIIIERVRMMPFANILWETIVEKNHPPLGDTDKETCATFLKWFIYIIIIINFHHLSIFQLANLFNIKKTKQLWLSGIFKFVTYFKGERWISMCHWWEE